jgi:hypothetical protein
MVAEGLLQDLPNKFLTLGFESNVTNVVRPAKYNKFGASLELNTPEKEQGQRFRSR